jgi:hypothetical protein
VTPSLSANQYVRPKSHQQNSPVINPRAFNIPVATSSSTASLQFEIEQPPRHDGLGFLSQMGQHEVHDACAVFNQKFPELRFLHLPTVLSDHCLLDMSITEGQQDSIALSLLLASVIALCAPMIKSSVLLPLTDQIMKTVQDRVSELGIPNLKTVQILLVLSMFKWGMGKWREAWITSGMAIRTMQTLLRPQSSTKVQNPDWQIYNRTLWSCFIIDRLIISGVPQPTTLSYEKLDTYWPSSEEDFIFGAPVTSLYPARAGDNLLSHMSGDMAHYFNTLVRGFDIWARILGWITSGGRRLPGMDLPTNHPWAAKSPWKLLYEELKTWRIRQESRSQYPEASVRSHAALGQAEPFGYLNLIYYVR